MEKDFSVKSDAFSTAQSKYQSAADQVRKYQDRLDAASRKLGGNSFNADGSLNFFVGYSNVSHLRSPLEITRDLHKYLSSDMLRLKQGRLELLLQELNDAFDHEANSTTATSDTALRTNMSASRSVLNLLRRVGGPNLTKSEIVRKAVCDSPGLTHFNYFSGLCCYQWYSAGRHHRDLQPLYERE